MNLAKMRRPQLGLLAAVIFSLSTSPLLARDVEAGRAKSQMCAVCHGPLGISTAPDAPHLAGQPAKDRCASTKAQTAEILQSIDALLKEAGTDKSRLLSAVIYLADMRHKAEMDEAWLAWWQRREQLDQQLHQLTIS